MADECHNRLSAFGVIGTVVPVEVRAVTSERSQSPFGFWGDWNREEYDLLPGVVKSHNRLSAFGVIGTTVSVRSVTNPKPMSQSPFGFWGDWNAIAETPVTKPAEVSQSPFGFWGDWNFKADEYKPKAKHSHNRLSAFGVIGTK